MVLTSASDCTEAVELAIWAEFGEMDVKLAESCCNALIGLIALCAFAGTVIDVAGPAASAVVVTPESEETALTPDTSLEATALPSKARFAA